MDHKSFYKLVVELRNKQKEYFRTRSQSALRESKALENRVDDEIKRVESILKSRREPQLFGCESKETEGLTNSVEE